MAADARVHPRLRIHANADIIGREVILSKALEDISMGGCRFGGPAWEEEGCELRMVLSFPDLDAHLPISGTVIRASQRDMGVRFHRLSEEQKWALRKHIREAQEASPSANS